MRCGLVTFLIMIGQQKGVLVLGSDASEVPAGRIQTASHEKF
jgi:hypothetical protein